MVRKAGEKSFFTACSLHMGETLCSHARTMQPLEVEMLDDIVAAADTSHFPSRTATPVATWPEDPFRQGRAFQF